MDKSLWDENPPNKPHYRNYGRTILSNGREYVETCHICKKEVEEGIGFVHNEGCHSVHCEDCLWKMLQLFEREREINIITIKNDD